MSEQEAVSKLGFKDTSKRTGVERLIALEEGHEQPSRSLLLKMTKLYRRPLLTFYLSAPPQRGDRGQDFRTLPDDHLASYEALLDALIRDVQARQSLMRSAILDEDEAHSVPFVGSATTEKAVNEMVESIRSTLDFSLEQFRRPRNVDDAFQALRQSVEEAGVFVLLLGNLGSHHTNIDLETFRGFVLSDDVAPFVIINDLDHHGAWSFTLLHELTHLWLGQTGVSGGKPEQPIEKFCNDVASEFLLPEAELRELGNLNRMELEEASEIIGQFARVRNVSMSMVAYKLFRTNALSAQNWGRLSHHFRELWIQDQQARRTKSRSSSGGPNYYVVRKHRLGNALVETTARFMSSGILTTTKAGRVLGVKPKNVQTLLATGVNVVAE